MPENKEKGIREIMPPIITFVILLFIVSTIGITRVSINTGRMVNTNEKEFSAIDINDSSDESIRNFIAMQLEASDSRTNQQDYHISTYYIYMNCLTRHLDNSGVALSAENRKELGKKLKGFADLIKLEGEKDFTKMSIDGRAIAIDIATQIYDICGLKLVTDMKGNIKQISDRFGQMTYYQNKQQAGSDFQVLPLILTLSVIIVLFGVVFYIGKYNRLFEKEVAYHGFDKKRYA